MVPGTDGKHAAHVTVAREAEHESMSSADLKAKAFAEIDRRMPEFKELLGDVIRIPTDNPPGDTTACVAFLADYLRSKGLPADVYEPKATFQSLVSYVTGKEAGPNLVLNGHLDQFPVGDRDAWSFDPYSGECRDGKILGRGVGDMKAGSVVSLICLLLAHELAFPIRGQLTLALVADEEVSGHWGTKWLLDNVPCTRGDRCLNSEPTTYDQVLIGHKGKYSLIVETRHAGGQGAMPVEDDAIATAMRIADAVRKLQGWKLPPPPEIAGAVERAKAKVENNPDTRGRGWVVDSTTVNIGVIQGGVQSNTIPVHCRMEIDIRPPIGVTTKDMHAKVEGALAEAAVNRDAFSVEWDVCLEAACSSPDDAIVRLAEANAREITGADIEVNTSPGSTDTRFWWDLGIPAAIYGTNVFNIAVPDEYVLESEFEGVLKVHAGTVIDYLCE